MRTCGRVFFEPGAKVYHGVPEQRITKRFLRQRYFWQGISTIRTHRLSDYSGPTLRAMLQELFSLPFQFVKNIRDPYKRLAAECYLLMTIGSLVEKASAVAARDFPPPYVAGA